VDELRALRIPVLPLLIATLRWHPRAAPPAFTELASIARDHLAKPQRAADDWSIDWTSPGGDDADKLEHFLKAKDERILEWPLAKPRRQQIHMFIDRAGLPMKHATRRQGSPQVLVLEKTQDLFTHET